MLQPVYTRHFQKDLRLMLRRGRSADNFKTVARKLVKREALEPRYRDHRLAGFYRDRRECHIEPDWLLVYKLTEHEIIFERTGTHSDLF